MRRAGTGTGRWRAGCLFGLALLCGALGAAAGADPQGERFRLEVGTGLLYFDNLLSREGEDLDVWGVRLNLRPVWQLDHQGEVFTHLSLSQLNYESFAPSRMVQWGLDWRGRPHSLDARLRYEWDHPSNFVGPELDRNRVLQFRARYGYRITDDWQIGGLAGWYRERFAIFDPKDNETWQAGLTLRYRGFGRNFSPEVGILAERQDAGARNYDYTQRDLLLQVRSAPVEPLYISFRYRFRNRDYDTGDDSDSNFGREDDRHQFQLLALWKQGPLVTWDFYAASESVDSLKPGSSRRTGTVGIGILFSF